MLSKICLLHVHAWIQECLPGGVQARLPENSSDNVFFFCIFFSFFRGGGGGSKFFPGVQLFPGGLNANLYRNP